MPAGQWATEGSPDSLVGPATVRARETGAASAVARADTAPGGGVPLASTATPPLLATVVPQTVELPVHGPHEHPEIRVPLGRCAPPARPGVDGPLAVLVHVLGIHQDGGRGGLDIELEPAPPDVRLHPLLGPGAVVQVLLEDPRELHLVLVPAHLLGPGRQPHESPGVPPAVGDLRELPVRRWHPAADAPLLPPTTDSAS